MQSVIGSSDGIINDIFQTDMIIIHHLIVVVTTMKTIYTIHYCIVTIVVTTIVTGFLYLSIGI